MFSVPKATNIGPGNRDVRTDKNGNQIETPYAHCTSKVLPPNATTYPKCEANLSQHISRIGRRNVVDPFQCDR